MTTTTNNKRTIVLPSVVSVALGRDSGANVDVRLADLPDNILPDLVATGIRLILNNCMAGAGSLTEKRAQVEKKLDAWKAGDFHVKAGAGGDSIEAEVKRIILERVATASGKPVTAVSKEPLYKGRGYEVCARIAAVKTGAYKPDDQQGIDTWAADNAADIEAVKVPLVEAAKAVIAARATAKASTATMDIADLF